MYRLENNYNSFDSFIVQFPDDDSLSWKIYFRDYQIYREIIEYVVFIEGIDYVQINRYISFHHEKIEGGI